jgi:hypothetical protein
MNFDHFASTGGRKRNGFIQRDPFGVIATFEGVVRTRVIDEDETHQPGGNPEEMRPALPSGRLRLADEAKPRLVDQGRKLQGLVGTASPQIGVGQRVEFPMNLGCEFFECCSIPVTRLFQHGGAFLAMN